MIKPMDHWHHLVRRAPDGWWWKFITKQICYSQGWDGSTLFKSDVDTWIKK